MSSKKSRQSDQHAGIITYLTTAGRSRNFSKRRRALTQVFAREIAKCHNAGTLIDAPANKAFRIAESGKNFEIIIPKSARMQAAGRLNRKILAKNLAKIACSVAPFASSCELLRFLQNYLRALDLKTGSWRGWLFLIQNFAHIETQKMLSKSSRAYLKSADFASLREGEFSGIIRKALPDNQLLAKNDSPLTNLEISAENWSRLLPAISKKIAKMSADQKSLQLEEALQISDQRYPILVDVFTSRCPVAATLPTTLNAHFKSVATADKLLKMGLATPAKLGALQTKLASGKTATVVITQRVATVKMHNFLTDRLTGNARRDSQNQQIHSANCCLSELGRTLRKLHEFKFVHRNFRSENIHIFQRRGESQSCPVIVIRGISLMKRALILTARRRFIGLMRLSVSLLLCPGVSHSGRLRMLKGYLLRQGAGEFDFKQYWRLLEDWSDSEIRKQMKPTRNSKRRS